MEHIRNNQCVLLIWRAQNRSICVKSKQPSCEMRLLGESNSGTQSRRKAMIRPNSLQTSALFSGGDSELHSRRFDVPLTPNFEQSIGADIVNVAQAPQNRRF